MVLTPYTLAALPRGAGTGAIRKALEKADVAAKWESSSWAKKLAARDQRKKQNDFERFEIGLLKRQRRDLVSRGCYRQEGRTISHGQFFECYTGPKGHRQGEEGCYRLNASYTYLKSREVETFGDCDSRQKRLWIECLVGMR